MTKMNMKAGLASLITCVMLFTDALVALPVAASVPASGNVEWEHIRKVLKDKTLPLNWRDSEGHSLVYYHMRYGTEQDAVELLQLARSKNILMADRESLAYYSAIDGKESLLRGLLASGVSPNPKPGEESLLMAAARVEQLGIMRQLIKAGANVNYELRSTSPPTEASDAVTYALETGKFNAARLLFDSGYDLAKRPRERITSMFYSAIAGNHSGAVRYFLERYNLLDSYGPGGETPLTYAAHGERNDLVLSELVLMGANPCRRNKAGLSIEDILREQDKGKEVYDRKYPQIRHQLVCRKTEH